MSCTCRVLFITFASVEPGLLADNYSTLVRISCLLCRNSRRQAPILVDLHGLHVSEAIFEIVKMRKWMVAAPLDSALSHPTIVRALPAMLCACHRGHHIMESHDKSPLLAFQPGDTIQHRSAEQPAVSGCAPVNAVRCDHGVI